ARDLHDLVALQVQRVRNLAGDRDERAVVTPVATQPGQRDEDVATVGQHARMTLVGQVRIAYPGSRRQQPVELLACGMQQRGRLGDVQCRSGLRTTKRPRQCRTRRDHAADTTEGAAVGATPFHRSRVPGSARRRGGNPTKTGVQVGHRGRRPGHREHCVFAHIVDVQPPAQCRAVATNARAYAGSRMAVCCRVRWLAAGCEGAGTCRSPIGCEAATRAARSAAACSAAALRAATERPRACLRLRARPAIMPSTPTPTAIRPTGPRMPKLAGAAMSAAHAGEPRVTKPPRTTSVVVPSRNAHSATEATLLRSWLRTRRTSQIAVTLVSGQILSPSRRKPTECVKSAARA